MYSLFFATRHQPFESIKIAKVSGTHNAQIGAMSPDGQYLAYVLNTEGNESLWLRHLASESNVHISPPQHVHYNALRFKPDGSHIYYSHTLPMSGPASQEFDLYRIPVLGGTPQVLVKDIDTNLGFSPDGQRFVFARANDPEPGKFHVLIANADGSNERSIASGPMSAPIMSTSWAQASGNCFYRSEHRSAEEHFDSSFHSDQQRGVDARRKVAGSHVRER